MRKPIIEARPVSLFGDLPADVLAGDGDPSLSPFEVPGYSDVRRKRDIQIASGEKPDSLNFRLHWVKTVNARDLPDKRKAALRQAEGYRALQWDEAKKYGLHLDKSAAEKGADGSVRLSEYTLFVADRKEAARNLARVESRNQNQLMDSLRSAPTVAGQTLQMAPKIEEPVAKK